MIEEIHENRTGIIIKYNSKKQAHFNQMKKTALKKSRRLSKITN